jgi:DNA transposition AAA+ family ATPase
MKLKEFIEKYRLSMTEAAYNFDCSVSHLANIINGRYGASNKIIRNIEKFTKGEVTKEDLLVEYKPKQKEVQHESQDLDF